MSLTSLRLLAGLASAFVSAAFCGAKAQALPVFAHRYGFSCQQCHTIVPQLNEFGERFAANGFRLNVPNRGTMPVAVKVNLEYGSDAEEGLPKAVVDEVELLSGGRIGNNTSYFVEQYVVDGGRAGMTRDAYVQFEKRLAGVADSDGATMLRVKTGQFTLPLPVDPESERPTANHYAVFDQTVGENGFNFFDPRLGFDVSWTHENTQAHVLALQSYDRQSGVPKSGVDTMATLSHNVNDNVALYAYAYRGQRHLEPLANRFHRFGVGATYDDRRFGFAAVTQRGNDTSSDAFGTPAHSTGAFVQGRYTATNWATVYYRYDRTFNDADGATDSRTLSLVLRPKRNFRLTLEGVRADAKTSFTGALLFAY
jgi:hypothetical protein